jgi:hypothetical protein
MLSNRPFQTKEGSDQDTGHQDTRPRNLEEGRGPAARTNIRGNYAE